MTLMPEFPDLATFVPTDDRQTAITQVKSSQVLLLPFWVINNIHTIHRVPVLHVCTSLQKWSEDDDIGNIMLTKIKKKNWRRKVIEFQTRPTAVQWWASQTESSLFGRSHSEPGSDWERRNIDIGGQATWVAQRLHYLTRDIFTTPPSLLALGTGRGQRTHREQIKGLIDDFTPCTCARGNGFNKDIILITRWLIKAHSHLTHHECIIWWVYVYEL